MLKSTFFTLKIRLPMCFLGINLYSPTEKMDKKLELTSSGEIEISGFVYNVKRLHEVPELIDECCDFINKEWKRSHTARLRSIEGSSEKFPMSLLLLKNGEKPEIVGHCRVSKLFMSSNKVFVETVVIHPSLRGKGLGKFLMNEVEELCKSKSITKIYLSTRGQEGFYRKLGYTTCPPVSIYGCQFSNSNENISEADEIKALPNKVMNNTTNVPPPPPLPKPSVKTELKNVPSKTFMSKNLF